VGSAWAWPYLEDKFARQPPTLAYKSAGWHQAVGYYRCEAVGLILQALNDDMPVVGGFSCFSSLNGDEVQRTGVVPLPQGRHDALEGGHAVFFVGADQERQLFKFQNSWSDQWGDQGYGYLPFAYVERGLSDDFWALSHEP
jgi:hypothetical protein